MCELYLFQILYITRRRSTETVSFILDNVSYNKHIRFNMHQKLLFNKNALSYLLDTKKLIYLFDNYFCELYL